MFKEDKFYCLFLSLYGSFKHRGGQNINVNANILVPKDENVCANQASLIIIVTRFLVALK